MIVNEIAKLVNPLHAAIELLLVAELREPLLVGRACDTAVAYVRHCHFPSWFEDVTEKVCKTILLDADPTLGAQ